MIPKKFKKRTTSYLILLMFLAIFSFFELNNDLELLPEKNQKISCRIGMTTNPNRRKKEWERKYRKQGNTIVSWNILNNYNSKTFAQEFETKEAKKQNCEAHPGGKGPEKAIWYIYKLEYLKQ